MEETSVAAVLKRHTPRLMSVPGVVGTAEAQCGGKPCIKVYVKKKSPDVSAQIPAEIEGYPVTIQETGEIRPLEPR